jgi:MFS family permease
MSQPIDPTGAATPGTQRTGTQLTGTQRIGTATTGIATPGTQPNGTQPTGTPSTVGAVPALTRREVAGWRNALFVIFALCGVALASWVARTPAIRDAVGASTWQMGMIVFGLAAGSMVGLTLSSHVLVRFGPAATIRATMIMSALGIVVTGLGGSLASIPVVIAGLMVFGMGTSVCDVSMNVDGAANERALGRTVMPIYHAMFSVGTIVGAAAGALAEHLGVPVAVHLSAVAVLMIGAVLVAVRFLRPDPALATGDTGQGTEPKGDWRSRLAVWRDRRTLLIGLIVRGMAFAEGSANDWLALAMVDGHGVDNATGALVFGIFVTAMTVGRVGGVFVLDRFGRVPVLRVSALLAGVGLVVMIFAPVPWLAVVGVVSWGLGSALGFPVGMSAAADDPKLAAARVSAVATIGYLAFLVGPPLVGFVGQQVGLLNALLIVLALVAVAGIVSPAAREPKRRTTVLAASRSPEPG